MELEDVVRRGVRRVTGIGGAGGSAGSAGSADRATGAVAVCGVTVVVPAHDEERHLAACLASLRVASQQVAVRVEVVVVLDACTDGSAALVPPGTPGLTALVVDLRNVGAARAAGFALACAHVAPARDHWLATTDADCEVPPSWLVDQLAAARSGADLVAGTVEVRDWSDRHPALPGAFAAGYHPGAGHRHVHGANLGLSAATYAQVGGFRPLTVHEDVDLVERCHALGATVCWSGSAPVVTSARVSTRTPHGFSAHLTGLEALLPEGVVA